MLRKLKESANQVSILTLEVCIQIDIVSISVSRFGSSVADVCNGDGSSVGVQQRHNVDSRAVQQLQSPKYKYRAT